MSEGSVATSSNRTFVALPGHFDRRPGRWPSPLLNYSPMISLGMLPSMKSGRRRPVTSRIEWANWEFSSCCFRCFECTEHARNETNEKTGLINSVEIRIWKNNMRNGVAMQRTNNQRSQKGEAITLESFMQVKYNQQVVAEFHMYGDICLCVRRFIYIHT